MSSTQTTSSKKFDFLSDYDIKGIIGKGTFSIVKLGENKKTKEKVAIKIMQKNKILSKDDLIRIEREIEILKRLSHPNVIKIHKIFEDEKRYYIIMEFCENGELFNRIVEKRHLTEDEASLFYYQLINGLEYIHKNNIVHRDLKPENLLLAKNDLLKIIDFGLSNYTENDLLLGTPCGSPCYASPEMVSGQRYNGYMIDVWSTGIILFAMVCGYLPFEDNNNEILFEKILKCRINYPGSMGKLTLDLMKKIITPDPKKRITLEQIKQHPFYLKGKGLFKKKFPKIISEVKNDEDNNKPIKEIIINNVTPIVKTNILKNIKENKGKINIDNNMCYPLNINEINNLYKSYQTEITKVNNLPSNINNTQDLNNINALKPYPNIKSEEKENIIKKDHKLESPSSLKSDEIPQDSVPVELSEVKNKIKNIPVKLDVKKNLKEEMNIISNSIHSKNIKINKIYKTNPKIPKEKEKDILYLSTKNRTIEKDRKKINNINYMTAKSQLNDRIVVDFYQKDKLISTLDNINNPSRAQKMDYYNMNEIQSKNKNAKVTYKFDKNSVLNNKPNNQINDDKNKVLIKEVSDEYLTNNKPNQNNNKLIKITNTFSKRIQRKPIYGINKLTSVKKSYFDAMNKVVESFLNQKYSKKGENTKSKQELQNKLQLLTKKKEDYKKEIDELERLRAEYMIEQGNIFADREEQERECTDDLKKYFKKYISSFENFLKNFKMSEEDLKIIEKINGDKDTKSFAESNKSLMTEPKRNVYKEYSIDINYYVENFDILKSKIKGKSPKEQREFYKEISTEITNLLANIIKEEPDKIYIRIEQIAKDIKENRLVKNDFDYLINKFQEQYDTFVDWKKQQVGDQEYKKVGKIWDERFFYMHVFLKYFNKTRVESKELNEENFNYLCNAIKKILELNENEDIDYNLCDLVVILSSTFYMNDPKSPKGKRYVNEVIRHSSIMQKQGFWVGLTRFELNEEIQSQNKIEDTLVEGNITEEKLINSVIAKLMSISYNIMQFVLDSELFNRIIHDVFKYCKINEQNRQIVVNMIDMQIQDEKIDYLKLDKENLLSLDKKE